MNGNARVLSTEQYPEVQFGKIILVGNMTQTGNTTQTGNLNVTGNTTLSNVLGSLYSSETYLGFEALKIDARDYLVVLNTSNAANDHSGGIVTLGGIGVAKDIYMGGAINNNYCCQLTKFLPTNIVSGVYTKVSGMLSSNTYGFNNLLSNMDNGTSDIIIRRAGKYRIVARAYLEIGTGAGNCIIGKNNVFDDTVFQSVSEGYQASIERVMDLTVGDLISLYVSVGSTANVGGVASYKGLFIRAELLY